MSRTILLIRHAKAIGGRFDRHLYPKEGAPLSDQGIKDAKHLSVQLENEKIDLKQTVAVSELIRTKQTAIYAGFQHVRIYDTLNEIESGMPEPELEKLLKNIEVPKKAITAAKRLLNSPPEEDIWVTHGMLIAGIGHVLNIPTTDLYIPDMASITKIHIN
ncbi:MAG: alpha-ribazole phosphatase [Patescibacteria group bacterium]|jgi:broad specificity phosphatase PhoE|nr:alpha-ribazole phosphatase [Patescibacteria group bacterium]